MIDILFLRIRRPPISTQSRSSAASDVYKRQEQVYVKGQNGYVILSAIGEEAVLTVMARQQAKLGLIFLDMSRAVKELEKLV